MNFKIEIYSFVEYCLLLQKQIRQIVTKEFTTIRCFQKIKEREKKLLFYKNMQINYSLLFFSFAILWKYFRNI